METTKLYYQDPFLREFTAAVTSCEETKGGYLVTLDRTAFYPEGGGQPYDTGTLGGAKVLEVHEKGGLSCAVSSISGICWYRAAGAGGCTGVGKCSGRVQ